MATLPSLSQEEREKVERASGVNRVNPISPEMYFLAEFGYFYHWEGVQALETGIISYERAQELLEATKMVWHEYQYKESLGGFYASKDSKSFNKGMKYFTDRVKVEQ